MAGVDIRKDDTVRVISGKDRGREGRVVRVLPREGRVMVDGVALAKKHQRATGRRAKGSSQQVVQDSGIIDAETFVNISNVQVVCPACGQATRVGHRIEGDRKVRFCRKCETELS
jgi:large subunit ribosomal protein L24